MKGVQIALARFLTWKVSASSDSPTRIILGIVLYSDIIVLQYR